MNELFEEYCGGMVDGYIFKGYLFGGVFGGILFVFLVDELFDFGIFDKYGCFIGSYVIVVFFDKDDMWDVVLNLMWFFKYESCG